MFIFFFYSSTPETKSFTLCKFFSTYLKKSLFIFQISHIILNCVCSVFLESITVSHVLILDISRGGVFFLRAFFHTSSINYLLRELFLFVVNPCFSHQQQAEPLSVVQIFARTLLRKKHPLLKSSIINSEAVKDIIQT